MNGRVLIDLSLHCCTCSSRRETASWPHFNFVLCLQKIHLDVITETDTIVVHSTDIDISKACGESHSAMNRHIARTWTNSPPLCQRPILCTRVPQVHYDSTICKFSKQVCAPGKTVLREILPVCLRNFSTSWQYSEQISWIQAINLACSCFGDSGQQQADRNRRIRCMPANISTKMSLFCLLLSFNLF